MLLNHHHATLQNNSIHYHDQVPVVVDGGFLRGADVVMGHDPECSNWIAVNRDPNAESRERRGRRGGRSRGRG